MTTKLDTSEVIRRFNQAFVEHDPTLLEDLLAENCMMESVEPAPDGTRYEGRDVCLAFWRNMASDRSGAFAPEDVRVAGDDAVIRWRYRFGPELTQSVRGVTLVHVRNGLIDEAVAYTKSGDGQLAVAVRNAGEQAG